MSGISISLIWKNGGLYQQWIMNINSWFYELLNIIWSILFGLLLLPMQIDFLLHLSVCLVGVHIHDKYVIFMDSTLKILWSATIHKVSPVLKLMESHKYSVIDNLSKRLRLKPSVVQINNFRLYPWYMLLPLYSLMSQTVSSAHI